MFEAEDYGDLTEIGTAQEFPYVPCLGQAGQNLIDTVRTRVNETIQRRPPKVICELEGIQVVQLGLRTTRYRQGV